jgi:hypothetical protein
LTWQLAPTARGKWTSNWHESIGFNRRAKRIKLFGAIAPRSAAYMVKQQAGHFDTISSTRAYCVRLAAQKKVVG